MKPWNERSGRMWAGMDSIVRFGLREGAASARDRIGGETGNQGDGNKPERNRARRRIRMPLARAISAGVGVPSQCRNFVRAGCFGKASQARLFQFPVDPQGCPVSPADYGQPTQGTSESDQRRHRSILVVHTLRPLRILSRKPAKPAIAISRAKWRSIAALEFPFR